MTLQAAPAQTAPINPLLKRRAGVLAHITGALGELADATGERRDLHLKGSGRTPFSRGGDGRAAVGPMLRDEVLAVDAALAESLEAGRTQREQASALWRPSVSAAPRRTASRSPPISSSRRSTAG